MEMFKHNYKGNYTSLYCPLCSTHPDSQEEAANCPEVKIETDDEERNTELYFKVFEEDIPLETVQMITRMIRIRENWTWKNK